MTMMFGCETAKSEGVRAKRKTARKRMRSMKRTSRPDIPAKSVSDLEMADIMKPV